MTYVILTIAALVYGGSLRYLIKKMQAEEAEILAKYEEKQIL